MQCPGARERRADRARRVVHVLELGLHGGDEPLDEAARSRRRVRAARRGSSASSSASSRSACAQASSQRTKSADERRVVDGGGDRPGRIARLGRDVEPQAVAQDRVAASAPRTSSTSSACGRDARNARSSSASGGGVAGNRETDRHAVLAERAGLAHRAATGSAQPSRRIQRSATWYGAEPATVAVAESAPTARRWTRPSSAYSSPRSYDPAPARASRRPLEQASRRPPSGIRPICSAREGRRRAGLAGLNGRLGPAREPPRLVHAIRPAADSAVAMTAWSP